MMIPKVRAARWTTARLNEDEGAVTLTVTATLSAANLAQADTEVKVKVATNADRYTLGPENGEITVEVTGSE